MFVSLLSRENPYVRRPALILYLLVYGPSFLLEPLLVVLRVTWRCLRANRDIYRDNLRNWATHYHYCIQKLWREGL